MDEPLPEPFVQPIPRPPATRPGGPPPWAGGPGGPPRPTVEDVRRAVAGDHELPRGEDEAPAAAVLIVVWEAAGEARVLLTRRTTWLRSHSGQVAFPGGRVDPGETPAEAALREAREEVGLDPSSVEIVGRLRRLHTVSGASAGGSGGSLGSGGAGIQPFVAVARQRPTIRANPDEVDRVFDVALGDLMDEGVFHEEIWGVPGLERPIYFFDLAGETIWGVTARMLHELLVLVTGRTSPPEPGRAGGKGGTSPP